MRTMKLGGSNLRVPVIAVGCMRIRSLDKAGAEKLIRTAMEQGLNFFDHADVYDNGACEEFFADAIHMNDSIREKIILQSKCGIRREGTDKFYDFSKQHILEAVDGSLRRLKTDYLDVLLLHRPDPLADPDEVAEAFDILKRSGKVRNFGVSNEKPMQIELLKKSLSQPILVNQLQLSVAHANMISNGVNVNMETDAAVDRDGSVLDYCRLHDITVQAWSPFQYGFFDGVFLGSDKFPELNRTIDRIAARHGVSDTTIALAWILRHPAHIQPVTGTMNVERLKACAQAAEIQLTRAEWWEIYTAAGNQVP
ncbi:MAG TPA: aldo/keto reductase [Ruminococcaceae bacterium]|mgnify:FL=1|nr:aldo/keto reductase [Oscillospiraceae bacterium]